jgi:ABC-2 type transport system ATP-binding protein
MSEEAPVHLKRLAVRYGRRSVVNEISVAVPKGSVYALLGRNGAGKSSIVRCLAGQQKPTRGTALLFGADAWSHRASLMRRVGLVPETPDAPPEMTVEALTRFCATLHGRWDMVATDERLRRFDVPMELPFGRLSKGQAKATMLALALGHGPELLILDDPTLGLDPVVRRWFFEELVTELADRGATVFMTTHDLAGVEGLADRVGMLAGGRLVLEEGMEALKDRTGTSLEDTFLAVATGGLQ